DMAAMGPRFGASATPSLADLVVAASRQVEQAREPGTTVHAAWAGDDAEPRLGALGGGSDHVGFYGHLGVPSISLGGGGSPGVSYHTNYEDLAWYRAVVGEDYEPARMLTDMVVTVAARLAEADLVPLAPAAYGEEAARRLGALAERWETRAAAVPEAGAAGTTLHSLAARAAEVAALAARARRRAEAAVAAGSLPPAALAEAHRALIAADRAWVDPAGLPGRPWYRNLFAAPDATSGYAAWVLPELVEAAEAGDAAALATAVARTRAALDRLAAAAAALEAAAAPSAGRAAAPQVRRQPSSMPERVAQPSSAARAAANAVEPAKGGDD
ncbi:MAG TPA: transferrin receptor-like dimerization domain-containing protein, partial [Thermoanaerobaculia bacterium]